jgi:hypothetical protein
LPTSAAGLTHLQNYAVIDAGGIVAATIAFGLILVPPGFVLGWCSNLLGFRQRSGSEKLLFSVALSIATVPILAVVVGRFASVTATLLALLLCLLAFVVLLREEFVRARAGQQYAGAGKYSFSFSSVPRSTWTGLGLMALWAVVANLSVMDLQIADRLYPSTAIFDYSIRIPLVDSAARTGVPPVNPFFGIGKPPVLRYYYYWYVICALPERLFHLSARACFLASVLWSGFALAAIIPLFLKHFLREREALRRKSLIGILLLAVTGLDLLPYGFMFLKNHVLLADMEWWDPNQITSWFDSVVWVPHHVAALTACMTGLLVLATLDESAGTRERIWAAVISGLAFASTAGLSIFVTFVFAIFGVVWSVVQLAQRRLRDVATYLAAAALALVVSLPYLADLQSKSRLYDPQSSAGGGAGFKFAIFAIRGFPGAIGWLRHLGLHGAALASAKLPIMIVVYLIEFGFFLVVGVLQFRREVMGKSPLGRQRILAWVLLASSLLVVSTLQSDPSATGGNDLGFRGTLLVQFILLLWAAPLFHDVFTGAESKWKLGWGWKSVLITTLVVGVLGTVCQITVLRCYALLVDRGKIERAEEYFGSDSPEMGKRIYRFRDGFTKIDKATTPASRVQYNPIGYDNWLMHLYSTRRVAAGDQGCSTTFGGDPKLCEQAMPYLAALFNSPEVIGGVDVDRICDAYSLNLLVAIDSDPVWRDPESWVWSRDAVVANKSLRAVPCGNRFSHSGR